LSIVRQHEAANGGRRGILPEIVEYDDHPWFVGVQFHSGIEIAALRRPLFSSFISAAVEQSRLV